jgi:WD40 repeat protein/serine/threonine protein kinase
VNAKESMDEMHEGDTFTGREIRSCSACGTKFSATSEVEFCPVCALRLAGSGGADLTGPSSEPESGALQATSPGVAIRFENYELVLGENGKPIELGRGAMGITYKAFDVDLRIPVTLKVIGERYLGDESARLRFLREARAAASVRHQNVASVFRLGRSGGNYFYAMEFVEGETLGRLIKRFGRLDVKLALEIASQVAAGLSAVQRENLVHRDIKPTNVMVSFDVGTGVTAKIIDLGLAKSATEGKSEAGISTPGAFAGTPHFASPEQCSGRQADIRSDLYSLGLTLWQMVTGRLPFAGSALEVMSQHLLAPLPIEQLKHVPQPVVNIIKRLLDKDPSRRPQSPSELQNMLRDAQSAFEVKARSRAIPRRSIRNRKTEPPRQRKQARLSGFREALPSEPPGLSLEPWDFTPLLVEKLKGFTGREWVFQIIDSWRLKYAPPALLIVGEPGVGKSTVLAQLIQRNPGGNILAYQCCRADTPATLDPAGFVRNLAAMISARLDDYAAILEGPSIADALSRSETDPASAFDAAILSPLHKIKAPEGGRRYLVIDALDESLARRRPPRIFDVLSTRFDRLPSWLGVVASMRDDPGLLSQLGSMSIYVLSAQDRRNQEDIRRFIQNRLSQGVLHDQANNAGRVPARVENDLLKSSAGNFLFVTTALDAVETGKLSFDQIETLSPGLRSLYELFFNRLFPDSVADFGPLRQVLETVAAAREPLTREQIAAATGLDAEEELPRILSRLGSFLPVCDGRYTFFHQSLFDWLTGWNRREDRPFAGPYYISLKNGRRRLAEHCWAEYQGGASFASVYTLRHLPGHLHEIGRDRDVRSVLLNFDFLQAKMQAAGPNKLIADYDFLPEDAILQLVQSAIRLSAHVLMHDDHQLASQLIGRLLGDGTADVQVLLQQALQNTSWPWLRPLKPTLAPPGGPLIRTFQGHTDWVCAVALTPDGRYAISVSWDRTLRLWDTESGQSIRIFEGHTHLVSVVEGHTHLVSAVAVTPDGDFAISGSADCTLRLWDLQSGQSIRTLEGHTGPINGVAVTPDGRRVLSGSTDLTLRLWDLETGRQIRKLEGHAGPINAVAVTPDGRTAVSASSDNTLRLWDLENGESIGTLQGHPDWVHAVVVMPDGKRVISGSADNTLRVWDLESRETLRTLEGHTNRVTTVSLMPDGKHAVSASADHTLRVWDLERGTLLHTLEGHTDWVTSVVVTPDGRRAVSGSADRTLRMWDLERGGESVHKLAGHTENVTAVAFLPYGRRAALVSDYTELQVWDLESGGLLRKLEGHTDWITAIAVTPDGRYAISASADHSMRLWNLESGQSTRTLTGHTDLVTAVAVTPDARRAISAAADRTLRIWNLETGQTVQMLDALVNLISAVAVTPDGRCAFWGSGNGSLVQWDRDSREGKRVLEGHTQWITAVAVTPDGRRALSASAGGTLRLWNLESGHLVRILQDDVAPVNAVIVTTDGRRAISAASDHTLRVWDLETGTCITAFTGESPMLRCVAAPDGITIIAREKSGRGHFLRLEGVD